MTINALVNPLCWGRAYKRWRHTHGYGVHSPFAYSLIENVISPGHNYSYYRESYISKMVPDKRKAALYKKIYRLAAFMNPKGVVTVGHPASLVEEMLREFSPANLEDRAQMMVARAGSVPEDFIRRHLDEPEAVLWLTDVTQETLSSVRSFLSEGLIIDGGSNIICICRRHMQRVEYTMYI